MTKLLLVAEDNEIIVDLLRNLLSSWRYAFEVTENGATALQLVRANDYALIIMDLAMPGMSGIDAARAIRKLPDPKNHTPIVALTGGMVNTTVAEMEAAGFASVLQKPVLPDDLREAIERCIGGPSS